MRIRDVARLVGAAILAAAGLFSYTTSASAWVGLSDKQKAYVEEYIHCKILLLTDIKQFEAEQPPCGGTPNVDLKSLMPTGSGGEHKVQCESPTGRLPTQIDECRDPS